MSVPPPSPTDLFSPMRKAIDKGEDMPAVVYIGFQGGTTIAPCIELNPHDTLLAFGVMVLQGQLDFPDWIAVLMDSYEYHGPADDPTPGYLGDLFDAGDPRVGEALHGLCLAPDGPSYVVTLPYVRDPDSLTVTWGAIKHDDPGLVRGPVPDAMRALLGQEVVSGT